MRTRTLGEGGPAVSVVGLGTNNFGWRCDYEQSLAVIDAALDAGITLFDTADIYGQGTSEDFIGRALEGRRDRVVLATKFGSPMDEHPAERRGSRDYIRWAVEGSLRRLRTDVIDVYQMHAPTRGRRSRRRSRRSTSSCRRAGCATSAPRTSRRSRSRRPIASLERAG